jgi:hypothetical protein
MVQSRLQDMYDEMIEHPNEMFIVSNSRHSALVSIDGSTFLIEGDFSGTPEECEAEARRIITQSVRNTRRRNRRRR